MFTAREYELIDFGAARRLERFGGVVVDRPCPTAGDGLPAVPAHWARVDLRFDRANDQSGRWTGRGAECDGSAPWLARHGELTFELRPTPLGQVGLFPEQATCWDWIAQQVRRVGRGARVLNLFAYTGGSTLAAAAAGAEVVHVDAARPMVAWARRNATRSGLSAAPIRWIVEDAAKFVAREARRGRRYDGLILDPPSYGHGPRGEPWKIERHLDDLLSGCAAILAERPAFVLLTCHSPQLGGERLHDALARSLPGDCRPAVRTRTLFLQTADDRRLPSGWAATWPECPVP